MISMDKTYRTRDGRDVRIYSVDGRLGREIHGAVLNFDGQWDAVAWVLDGCFHPFTENSFDLIEVKPRIQRTVWANVYANKVVYHPTKELAKECGSKTTRLACVKVEIDCEEGEGL